MGNLILSKGSGEAEMRSYFNAILELSKSDNEFPCNLDEVWMLVYSEKGKAVRALKENFIEGVDFKPLPKNGERSEKVFAQNGKNTQGGRPTNDYYLTISCMEFFIARKVRPVFEVYRQVFHKAAKRELSRKELALMVVQAEEEKERLMIENEEVKQRNQMLSGENEYLTAENKALRPMADYTKEVLQSTSTYTLTQVAHDLGLRSVHALTRILMEKKILFRQSGQWQPAAKVAEKGYFDTRTAKYVKPDNTIGTSMSTVITESGRQFLHTLINGRF